MYITTIIPTKENHTIDIPEEFYGKQIKVIAQPVSELTDKNTEKKLAEIESMFSKYKKIDLVNFVFDRDEANNFNG
ncbi:MAG: hypothetical protein SFY32_05000 [Bacteroidota bacterium]|nr:hypothetical protein [Bacteroidota bacterium]